MYTAAWCTQDDTDSFFKQVSPVCGTPEQHRDIMSVHPESWSMAQRSSGVHRSYYRLDVLTLMVLTTG
jgi:hypothetical protein